MKKVLIFQHIPREHPSTIVEYARERGIELDILRLWEDTRVPTISPYDALIVMGGPMGVYEDYKNKKEELHGLANAIGTIPVLGICLGAQLLAHALGSSVYPFKKEGKPVKEIGYYPITLTDEGKASPLFRGFSPDIRALQWHGDTFDLPKGAALLARGAECENQAFSYDTAYGLQFHIEATPRLVEEWLTEDAVWVNTDFFLDEEQLRKDAATHAAKMKQECYMLLDNFFSV